MCRKYRGKMSATNRSGSRTEKASPLGNQDTMVVSSFLSISMSLRGNGFEPPVDADDDAVGVPAVLPGDEVAERAGDEF